MIDLILQSRCISCLQIPAVETAWPYTKSWETQDHTMLHVDAKVGEILVDSAIDLQARKQMEKEKEERKKESEAQSFSWPLSQTVIEGEFFGS